MPLSYTATKRACYIGYITQAIINNLTPLLFIIFFTDYGLSYDRLGGLIMLNFFTQLIVDGLSALFVDRIGYRICLVGAHIFCVAGLILLSVLPMALGAAGGNAVFLGLCGAVIVYALGGGLLEVLISPVVEAIPAPADQKASGMSLLHSFYCWGQVLVVVVTTLILFFIGSRTWFILPVLWAIVPFCNLFLFAKVPLAPTVPEGKQMGLKRLLSAPAFLVALVLMACAGSSELTMSQWASLFAEQELGLSKMWGDLAGVCMFGILMGIGRTIYGVWGSKIRLKPFMLFSSFLCLACYLLVTLSPSPVLSLIACAICGFSVSIMWPGTYSLTAARFPMGGTAMFAVLALFGDLGGSFGPWLAGMMAERADSGSGLAAAVSNAFFAGGNAGLKTGLLICAVFPLVLIVALCFFRGGAQQTEH